MVIPPTLPDLAPPELTRPDHGRWFDAAWYRSRNPDVARAGIDPLGHYWRYGEAEGRKPSVWFDPAWYRRAYSLAPEISPLAHFLAHRTSGQYLPRPELFLAPRLPPWREGPALGFDPFDRYLTESETPERELLPDLTVLRSSGLIGANYFLLNGMPPDERSLDPVLHYCRIGVRFGARPNDVFDPAWYAARDPAPARLGINPLTHYILDGEPSGRRPALWFDPVWYRKTHAPPPDISTLAHYLANRHTGTVGPNEFFDAPWYVARHGHEIPAESDPFSHYLVWGAVRDIAPSPGFDARLWRHRHMAPAGAPGQDRLTAAARNPLLHYLRATLAG